VAWSGFGFQDFATARADFGNIVPVTSTARTCRVSYVVSSSWPGGFQASVTVYNNGPAVSNWALGFSLPAGQSTQGRWGAYFQQNGTSLTATNEPHNGAIPTGGAVTFGFTANGPVATPPAFTLNGRTCA
jgi:cellulase/cellobiase CelA1